MISNEYQMNDHIEQTKKQFKEAVASKFLSGEKSQAKTLRTQSIFATVAPLVICFITVFFLQVSQYCPFIPSSKSTRWKLLLQLPVITVLPSGEAESANLSKIASFSTISLSLDFRPSFSIMVDNGFLGLHTSHSFTVRQSRDTMYLPPRIQSIPVQFASNSQMQFFCWVDSPKDIDDVSAFADIRRSAILRLPLLFPQMKRLSLVGWYLLQVMFTSRCQSAPPFGTVLTTRQGWSGLSKLHNRICPQSAESRYYQFLEGEMELIGARCLLGNTICVSATYEVSTFWSFGIERSLPESFTIFFYVRSNIFHTFMLRSLAVAIFRYLPWALSQSMPVISSLTYMLRSGSNSRTCDWNQVKYSQLGGPFLAYQAWKTMMRPALSPTARQFPVWSNLMLLMMSSYKIFQLGPLYPNT